MEFVNKWYLIYTYSGYEKKVRDDLKNRVKSLDMLDRVFRIFVPEEEVEEEKRGKKVITYRKLFPSYVMVEMRTNIEETGTALNYHVDSEAWYAVRNTNGVTGFVGVGSDPIPMSDEEVERIMQRVKTTVVMPSEKISKLKIGDIVDIIDGDYLGNVGTILEIYKDKEEVMLSTLNGKAKPILKVEQIKK
ncbi:transcription termination/antitermination protein NusG [Sneathia sanguinegens]|uniref:transcription termination/antitermination protein NusG n=1 Tax=Sneathia sanguinegens TaxID=40543 RepID=UPI0035C6C3F1